MDERAKGALFKAALEYFRNYDFGGLFRLPDESFSKALLTHFDEYGSPFFLGDVAHQTFRHSLSKRVDIMPRSGRTTEHFSDETLREAVAAVVDAFVAPPRTYLYYFPMSGLFGANRGRISLTSEIFFEEFPFSTHMVFHEAGFDLTQPRRNRHDLTHTLTGSTVYLCIKARGLFLPDGIFGPTAEAISTAKQLLMLSELSTGAMPRSVSSPDTKPHTGFVVDENVGLELAAPILLPETLSTALDGWNHWPWDEAESDGLDEYDLPPPPDDKTERPITGQELTTFLVDSLKVALQAIDSKTNPTEAIGPGVLTASTWGFDSLYERNAGARVLFLGIAFEALLGNPKEVITKTLADRLAYLIGTSHKERDTIRSDFTEFYQLRSKVAHGEAQRLSWDDTVRYGKAFGLFERALAHEIRGSGAKA